MSTSSNVRSALAGKQSAEVLPHDSINLEKNVYDKTDNISFISNSQKSVMTHGPGYYKEVPYSVHESVTGSVANVGGVVDINNMKDLKFQDDSYVKAVTIKHVPCMSTNSNNNINNMNMTRINMTNKMGIRNTLNDDNSNTFIQNAYEPYIEEQALNCYNNNMDNFNNINNDVISYKKFNKSVTLNDNTGLNMGKMTYPEINNYSNNIYNEDDLAYAYNTKAENKQLYQYTDQMVPNMYPNNMDIERRIPNVYRDGLDSVGNGGCCLSRIPCSSHTHNNYNSHSNVISPLSYPNYGNGYPYMNDFNRFNTIPSNYVLMRNNEYTCPLMKAKEKCMLNGCKSNQPKYYIQQRPPTYPHMFANEDVKKFDMFKKITLSVGTYLDDAVNTLMDMCEFSYKNIAKRNNTNLYDLHPFYNPNPEYTRNERPTMQTGNNLLDKINCALDSVTLKKHKKLPVKANKIAVPDTEKTGSKVVDGFNNILDKFLHDSRAYPKYEYYNEKQMNINPTKN